MRVYWMKVHMRFCECACLRGGCVWRQSVWVWVHSCRDDVTSWKLIHSAYRWGHWFLELGSGSLNEGFPAVMATAQLLWGFTVSLCVCLCVCAGVWGGAVQTQPISKATALRHVYQCLPLLFCMRIPWCHFSFRHRGSQVTPPLCHSVNTHTHSHEHKPDSPTISWKTELPASAFASHEVRVMVQKTRHTHAQREEDRLTYYK